MYWADFEARERKYSKTSEVYSFGLCAHYLIWGQPIYHEGNERDYYENDAKSENAPFDSWLLQGVVNWCLVDDLA